MEITNRTIYNNQIFNYYYKFFFRIFLIGYIIGIMSLITFFTYNYLRLPSDFNKISFLLPTFFSVLSAIIITPILFKRAIKKSLFNSETICEYKFDNLSIECNKTEKGINNYSKFDYSRVRNVVETKEIFIIYTKSFNSLMILDKGSFILGNSSLLKDLLKMKVNKYKDLSK